MKDVLIIVLAAAAVWALLSRASDPPLVAAEHERTVALGTQVAALQTRVVEAKPTATPTHK